MDAGGSWPRLREGIEVRDDPSDRFVASIEDPARGFRIRLDAKAREITRLLDGTRDVPAISRDLFRAGHPIPEPLVRKTLEFLGRHGLLEDGEKEGPPSENAFVPGRFVLRLKPDEIPTRVFFLPEARHGCAGCGRCCGGYILGPIEQEAAERIRAARFGGELEWLDRTPKVVEGGIEGLRFLEIEKRGGRCIFLEGGRRCILHRLWGEESKPAGCRLFPIHFCLLPTGAMIGYLRMECFEYHRARKRGAFLAERLDEIRTLLALSLDVRSFPSDLRAGHREMGLEEYLALEEAALEAFAGPRGIEAALWAIGRSVSRAVRGEPAGGLPDGDPPPRNDRLLEALFGLARGLARRARDAAAARDCDPVSARIAGDFADTASAFIGEGAGADRAAVDALPSPEEDPEGRAILAEALRNEVFSKEWIIGGDVARGFALTLLRGLLFVSGARILAARRGAARPGPAETCEGVATVNRAIRWIGTRRVLAEEGRILDAISGAL
jgi:hypothetical protein